MKRLQPNYQTVRLKNVLFSHNVWWVDLDWLPDTNPATLLFPSSAWRWGQNKMENHMGWAKDSMITYQLLSQGKQTCNDEFEFIAN